MKKRSDWNKELIELKCLVGLPTEMDIDVLMYHALKDAGTLDGYAKLQKQKQAPPNVVEPVESLEDWFNGII